MSNRLTPSLINGLAYNSRCTQKRDITIDVHMHSAKKSKKTKQKRDSGRASYRFVDRTRVKVSGGSGGNGSMSMLRIGRKHKRRPDGGHGGNGGSIIIVADKNEQSLRWTKPHVTADSGTHGSSQCKHGKNANNTVLRVPCGVIIRRVLDYDEQWDDEKETVIKLQQAHEEESESLDYVDQERLPIIDQEAENLGDEPEEGEDFEIDKGIDYAFIPWGEREKVQIADLDTHGSYAVVAKGGKGGTGSSIFASSNSPLPNHEILADIATPKIGETAFLELELKLIADIGLVGFPNAGKSSLLAAMSRATPHIAPYPFTTLNPLVGYVEYTDGYKVCVADVPGLIEGAAEGKGKGHDFLRHIERTKALIFIVDAAGVDGRDPISDLRILIEELAAYGDGDMLNRRSLVVANKIDLLDEAAQNELRRGLESVAEAYGISLEGDVISTSVGVTGEGLSSLSKALREIVTLSEANSVSEK